MGFLSDMATGGMYSPSWSSYNQIVPSYDDDDDDDDCDFYNSSRYKLGSTSVLHNTKNNSSSSSSKMIMQDLEQKSKRRTPEEEARIQSQIDEEFRNADPYGSHSHLQPEPWKYKSKRILLSIIFAVYFTVIGFGFAIIIKL